MKGTLTRKQREIQSREGRILEVARSMIVQDGYHGLSMDRIAEALEYSKGTIYQHFSCKEEILMALVNQAMERRLDLFRRAAAFRGVRENASRPSARRANCSFSSIRTTFTSSMLIRISSVREKTSEQRRLLSGNVRSADVRKSSAA